MDDLLLSVKKTEDSLLRLKQQRKAAAGQANTVCMAKSNEISDENKIRMQVALDVGEYIKQVMFIHANSIFCQGATFISKCEVA